MIQYKVVAHKLQLIQDDQQIDEVVITDPFYLSHKPKEFIKPLFQKAFSIAAYDCSEIYIKVIFVYQLENDTIIEKTFQSYRVSYGEIISRMMNDITLSNYKEIGYENLL